MWVLVIGLAWLAITAAACVLIGRAIRSADARDEELALLARERSARSASIQGLTSRRIIMPPTQNGKQFRHHEGDGG